MVQGPPDCESFSGVLKAMQSTPGYPDIQPGSLHPDKVPNVLDCEVLSPPPDSCRFQQRGPLPTASSFHLCLWLHCLTHRLRDKAQFFLQLLCRCAHFERICEFRNCTQKSGWKSQGVVSVTSQPLPTHLHGSTHPLSPPPYL